MNEEAQYHPRKAARFLGSVEKRAESDEPETIVSTACYAMFHAACAVVLEQEGRLPKTHSSLIGRFGLIVRDRGIKDREFGARLHDAFELRAVGDYEIEAHIGRIDALASRDKAREFISYCRRLLRDRSSPTKG
jgi:uncharacterized protein (UPF0332 family)